MSGALAPNILAAEIENVLIAGDLSKLTAAQRVLYVNAVCQSVGLNPLTQPFKYITLSGKLTLYATKDCTDQLRALHDVSVVDLAPQRLGDLYVVTCKVTNAKGRTDCATGAVAVGTLKGEALANALMKTETKAKRRATLSICGLGLLDESEIPAAEIDAPAALEEPPRITKTQQKQIFAQARAQGWSDAQLKSLLEQCGYASTKDIPADQFEDLMAALETRPPAEEQP